MDAEDHSDLIHLGIEEAMRMKFLRGRDRYENGPWVGPEPIYAAHDEILDFLVYITRAFEERMINKDMHYSLMRTGLDLIRGIRIAIDIHEKEKSE